MVRRVCYRSLALSLGVSVIGPLGGTFGFGRLGVVGTHLGLPPSIPIFVSLINADTQPRKIRGVLWEGGGVVGVIGGELCRVCHSGRYREATKKRTEK